MDPNELAKAWPTKCEMPELSGLSDKLTLRVMMLRMFNRGGPSDAKSWALLMNYIRIVDALVTDYQDLRRSLTEYVTARNGHFSPLFVAISSAEECVTNLSRAIQLAQRIRNDKLGPPIERKLPVLHGSVAKRVRDFRNAIQHLDDILSSGEWTPPDPNCLIPRNDRLEIFGQEILYTELAEWTKSLHDIAQKLSQYKETT